MHRLWAAWRELSVITFSALITFCCGSFLPPEADGGSRRIGGCPTHGSGPTDHSAHDGLLLLDGQRWPTDQPHTRMPAEFLARGGGGACRGDGAAAAASPDGVAAQRAGCWLPLHPPVASAVGMSDGCDDDMRVPCTPTSVAALSASPTSTHICGGAPCSLAHAQGSKAQDGLAQGSKAQGSKAQDGLAQDCQAQDRQAQDSSRQLACGVWHVAEMDADHFAVCGGPLASLHCVDEFWAVYMQLRAALPPLASPRCGACR